MTKLTTESLEKFVNDIKTDGMCDITDYQVALALRQLLAYEQAAKNPVASCWSKGGILQRDQFIRYDVSSFPDGEIKLFAAPVLPKQPVKPVMFIDGDISSDDAEKLAAVIREFALDEVTEAQPVIQETKYSDFHDWLKGQNLYAYQVAFGELEASEDEVINAKATIMDMSIGWKAAIQSGAQAAIPEQRHTVPDEIMPSGLVYSSVLPEFESNDSDKVVGYHCLVHGKTRSVMTQEQAYSDAMLVVDACRAAFVSTAQPVIPDNDADDLIQRLSGRAQFLVKLKHLSL